MKEIILIEDAQSYQKCSSEEKDEGKTKNIIVTPIQDNNKAYGIIKIFNSNPKYFLLSYKEFLNSLFDVINKLCIQHEMIEVKIKRKASQILIFGVT